jgi:hypothetical protein
MTAGDIERIEDPICFSTANGPVWASSTLPLQGVALMEEINPYVMESTPAVLSIGRRCMVHGFSFHWPAYKSPYFTKPSGEKIFCDVHAYVPYLRHRDPAWDEGSVAAAATSARNSIVPIRRIQLNDVPEAGGGGNAPALLGTARK